MVNTMGIISKIFSWKVGMFFLAILFINGLYISIQAQSFEPFVLEFGDKAMGSLVDLDDELFKIVENEQIISHDSNTWWKKSLDVFTTYTTLLMGAWMILIWVRLWMKILDTSNDSNTVRNFWLAMIIVLLGNGIYIAGTRGFVGLSIFFDIFKNGFRAFPYLFDPLRNVAGMYHIQEGINLSNVSLSGILNK